MNRVFAVQEQPKLNYADAERFGEVNFIAFDDYSPVSNSERNQATRERINAMIEDHMKATDHLLLVGDPILIGLAIHKAIEKFGQVNVLKWDRMNTKYVSFAVKP